MSERLNFIRTAFADINEELEALRKEEISTEDSLIPEIMIHMAGTLDDQNVRAELARIAARLWMENVDLWNKHENDLVQTFISQLEERFKKGTLS